MRIRFGIAREILSPGKYENVTKICNPKVVLFWKTLSTTAPPHPLYTYFKVKFGPLLHHVYSLPIYIGAYIQVGFHACSPCFSFSLFFMLSRACHKHRMSPPPPKDNIFYGIRGMFFDYHAANGFINFFESITTVQQCEWRKFLQFRAVNKLRDYQTDHF